MYLLVFSALEPLQWDYFSVPSYRKQAPTIWLPNVTKHNDFHIIKYYL